VIDFERTLLGILWLFWLVYWISVAQRTAPNRRMETLLEGASYRIPLAIGVFLTVFWWMPLFLRIPALWTQSPLAAGTGSWRSRSQGCASPFGPACTWENTGAAASL